MTRLFVEQPWLHRVCIITKYTLENRKYFSWFGLGGRDFVKIRHRKKKLFDKV